MVLSDKIEPRACREAKIFQQQNLYPAPTFFQKKPAQIIDISINKINFN